MGAIVPWSRLYFGGIGATENSFVAAYNAGEVIDVLIHMGPIRTCTCKGFRVFIGLVHLHVQ